MNIFFVFRKKRLLGILMRSDFFVLLYFTGMLLWKYFYCCY
nr:MAG TPA: hypothetical protein [Caudoviricetes sp.]